ncbi:MAG TPA: TolC family protein [Longimicrobiales bacterium]|nr:TolC family protein [Longimicrobiales bacterium]
MNNIIRFVGLVVVWVLAGAPLGAQERPVTLREAVQAARSASPDVLAAQARAEAALQGRRASAAYRLPTVGLEAGAIRSDDPVAAFGGRLRQGRFTQADFDPAGLNHPDALTDWSGAIGAMWAPLDFSADAAYQAAGAEAEAAGLGAAWAARAAAFRGEARYVEAVGAERRLAAAASALAAAEENERIMGLRRDEGLLTDADLLQAKAALEGARARHIDARRAVDDARGRLAVAMGWEGGVVPVPADSVFPALPAHLPADVAERPDLLASAAAVRAADARVSQARRSRLPTVQGFARLATHSTKMFDGAEEDWTLGFQVRVPLFTGFAISSHERAASAMREAAAQDHRGLLREAEAQLAEAVRAVASARQGSAAAEAGAEAAAEAARLMRRRFEEGLTTTADLLGVEAQAAALATQAVNARLGLHLAVARLAFLSDTTTSDFQQGFDR